MQLFNDVQDLLVARYPAIKNTVIQSRPVLTNNTDIGYCPEGDVSIVNELRYNGYLLEELLQVGLVKDTEENTTEYIPQSQRKYELTLHGRWTLPIRDWNGEIISFAGRAMGDKLPKYKNLANSHIFTRGNEFFPEHLFNPEHNTVLLCEGYIDSLAAHEYGCSNCLSMFGIQITDAQVHKLHQLQVHNFIIALDNDLSGRLGTLKSILAIKAYNIHSYCAIMNLTEDIDEMSKEDFWKAYDSRVYIDEIHPLQIINDTLAQIDLTTTKHEDIMSNGGWSVILQYCDFFASPFTPDIKRQIQDTFGKNVSFKKMNLNRGYYK